MGFLEDCGNSGTVLRGQIAPEYPGWIPDEGIRRIPCGSSRPTGNRVEPPPEEEIRPINGVRRNARGPADGDPHVETSHRDSDRVHLRACDVLRACGQCCNQEPAV